MAKKFFLELMIMFMMYDLLELRTYIKKSRSNIKKNDI
jgi:hypothetical protein